MTITRHQPLLQEIHAESKKKNHAVILWYKFLNKTKYVGHVITFPLTFVLVCVRLFFSFDRWCCLFELTSHYVWGLKVYRREPMKKRSEAEIKFIQGEGPSHRNTIIFNLLWLTFGLGFLTILSLFLIGVLLMVTIVGISSGLETMRLTRYLLWPCGYQYFPFDGEYYSKAEWEREKRLLDLKMRYKNQHVISTSSIRHQHFV